MKKLLCLFLALFIVFSMTACGGAGLTSTLGGGTVVPTLSDEVVHGTWRFTINVKEKLPAVLGKRNAAEEEPMPQQVLDILIDAVPDDIILGYRVVFENGSCNILMDLEGMTAAMRSIIGSVFTEEVLLAVFEIRGLSEDEIRQQCGGVTVKEYVDFMKPLLMEQIDYSQLADYAGNVEQRNGYMIVPAGDYHIEGNHLIILDGESKSCFTYDGNMLTMDISALNEEDIPEAARGMEALFPIKLIKVNNKTSY